MKSDPSKMRSTDQRDVRHKRARERGDELIRRATDRESLTDTEVEEAVARRWNLAPRMPARSEQAAPGVAELRPTVDVEKVQRLVGVLMAPVPGKPRRKPSWFARMRARFAMWRVVR